MLLTLIKKLESLIEYSYDENKSFPGAITIYEIAKIMPETLKNVAKSSLESMYDESNNTANNHMSFVNFYLDTISELKINNSMLLNIGIINIIIFMSLLSIYIILSLKTNSV